MSRAIVVVPCYNEARRLDTRKLIEFAAEGNGHTLLFVNDGSQDATAQLLGDLQSYDSEHFQLLDLPANRGKAEAVRQGVLAAFPQQPDYVGYWDADLATPLADIGRFCDLLDRRPDLELVSGARVPLLGRAVERTPLRNLLGRAFAAAASWTLGLPVYDTQCGAKLFRASPLMRQAFASPFLSRWLFDVEVLARLIQERRRQGQAGVERIVYELPLERWHDVAGSKVRPKDFFKAGFELAAIRRRYFGKARASASPAATQPTAVESASAPQAENTTPMAAAAPLVEYTRG